MTNQAQNNPRPGTETDTRGNPEASRWRSCNPCLTPITWSQKSEHKATKMKRRATFCEPKTVAFWPFLSVESNPHGHTWKLLRKIAHADNRTHEHELQWRRSSNNNVQFRHGMVIVDRRRPSTTGDVIVNHESNESQFLFTSKRD